MADFRRIACKRQAICQCQRAGAIVIFTLSLYTNQEFHNGVWGPLHNKSVKPKIEISDAQIENNSTVIQCLSRLKVSMYTVLS